MPTYTTFHYILCFKRLPVSDKVFQINKFSFAHLIYSRDTLLLFKYSVDVDEYEMDLLYVIGVFIPFNEQVMIGMPDDMSSIS